MNYNFSDKDDPEACYACGCLDFNESWNNDCLDSFVSLHCANCGAEQGWWYKKLWLEKNKKNILKVNKSRNKLWDSFVKSVNRAVSSI